MVGSGLRRVFKATQSAAILDRCGCTLLVFSVLHRDYGRGKFHGYGVVSKIYDAHASLVEEFPHGVSRS